MHIQSLRHTGFDVAQEGQKLLVPVARLALRDDGAVGHVEGSAADESGLVRLSISAVVGVVVRHYAIGVERMSRLYFVQLWVWAARADNGPAVDGTGQALAGARLGIPSNP